ncbi:amidohydrolase [Mycetocola reblochoni]|uniref:Peptidase M20 domain-containing protein 2 n=2 Tax=Mycetocola reblochoni TaxID=331618 RepID=A0A1R4KEF3_9MICO|nr:amidohydrolase [Mycetocola reblochoni]RLP71092.1 M20 family peptidase [Mycetocola reblochoni]SJN42572.1 Catalyzes the cleavage of p-aminobenzoyl-glutamate to p-aminobenzoate and glutamate, subunit A [Mycetocola reblochoni REB411]
MHQHTPNTIPSIIEQLTALVPARMPQLTEVAADLHAHPEIRFTEVRAAALLSSALDDAGFAVTRGFAGLDTAFVARWSTPDAQPGDTTIAVFCEYDALEEIGHACGHNIIAAAGLGAGLLIMDFLTVSPVPANLIVIGSPGEEGAAGKVPMIEAGVLDGVDLAIMIHPGPSNSVDGTTLSRVALDIDFHGKSSHAAAAPALGRNALDAATLSLTAIGLLRQQLTDDVRIHTIITNGGDAPNIIPEHTAMRAFVRAADREHLLNDVLPRVHACFEGAAIATGTSVTAIENTPRYDALRSNPVLVSLAEEAYLAVGREINPDPDVAGSTDMGNVSQLVPAIHPIIELEAGVAPHTRAFAAAAAGEYATSAIQDGSVILAATAIAAFRDRGIVDEATRQFDGER